ncbi:MAG: hypothetical protein M0P47_09445 [Bacteroidales bacterium]|nr:hypothetical protein [Bacteroidales bacterium]
MTEMPLTYELWCEKIKNEMFSYSLAELEYLVGYFKTASFHPDQDMINAIRSEIEAREEERHVGKG